MKNCCKMLFGWMILVILDQISKLWVLNHLKGKEPIVLIENVFEFHYVENRGAAFGIMQNKQWLFLVITMLVLAGLVYLTTRIPQTPRFFFLRFCILLVGGGAIGNLIDRVFRKYVVDFLYFKLIDFPVFNVADIFVTCAAFLVIFLVLFYYKEEELDSIFHKKQKEQES